MRRELEKLEVVVEEEEVNALGLLVVAICNP